MQFIKRCVLACSLFLATMAGGAHKKNFTEKTIQVIKNGGQKSVYPLPVEVPQITIWIPGTRGLGFFSDLIHSIPTQGITHVTTLPSYYLIGSTIQTLAQTDPIRFPLEHFYVYGWSGKLSFEEREKEAYHLLHALKVLIDDYEKKYESTPTIRLITHSHGGNVVLNMAKAKKDSNSLKIAQVILLACPVQHETKEYVNDPLFEQIYSIYSSRDLIQILDPQGLYLTSRNDHRHLKFSERVFPHADNIKQAEIKINGHGIGHAGFIFSSFTSLLPSILEEMETWHHDSPNVEPTLLTIKTK